MPSLNSQELLKLYQEGRDDAATAIFNRYVARLLALARGRIGSKLTRRIDPDDVVQSAYRSFFIHAKDDEYQLAESGDLWRLLASITLNKLHKQVERQTAAKRNFKREDATEIATANIQAAEPSAAEATALVEELQSVLASITPNERQVLTLRLQGQSAEQISPSLDRSTRTVRRLLTDLERKIAQRLLYDEPAPRTTSEPHAPLLYSDYVLEELIGSGGMGKVFRARDKKTSQTVAIKALHKSRQTDARAVSQFVQEAQVLATLRHPNIVGIQGLGRFPSGGYFIVMDFVEGGDLQTKLRYGPLPVAVTIRIVGQIASAIGYAHEHGIVHCDLKPGNVLLASNGEASVTDFGFAYLVAKGAHARACSVGGTIGYIAPEVLYLRSDPTPAADIYALGMLLWEMATGNLPYDSQNLTSDIEGLEHLHDSVARCIAEDPHARYESAAVFERQLRETELRLRSGPTR